MTWDRNSNNNNGSPRAGDMSKSSSSQNLTPNDKKCKLCKEAEERIANIRGPCKKIAQTDYKLKHNTVTQMIEFINKLHQNSQ